VRALAIALAVIAGVAGVAVADTGTVAGKVTVVGADGKPVSPAGTIVYIVGFDEPAPKSAATIRQRDKMFVPDLIAVTAGQDVSFPNGDPILHNVFSRSATRPFDLGSYKRGETKTKTFPKAGVVDVYCNIHPEMAATIVVVPNRRHAVVGADGAFSIAGVPAGTWQVYAYTRLAVSPARADVTVTGGKSSTVALDVVRGAAAGHRNKYGEKYRDPTRYR
jgi:plastocyanin